MAEFVVPEYLEKDYWWAYARPWAVWLFDRQVAVNLILYGQYNFLRDRALEALGERLPGRTLQVGCCYGNVTPFLAKRVELGAGTLDVVDALQIQVDNLPSKLPAGSLVSTLLMDSAALSIPDATYDRILVFMLLHEQPPAYRRKTLAEALRVLKPDGRIVIIDYARHTRWHPLKPYLPLLCYLKPYVREVFHHELSELLPEMHMRKWRRNSYFGGLLQMLVSDGV